MNNISEEILAEIAAMPVPSLIGRERVPGILVDSRETWRHEDAIWVQENNDTAIVSISIIDIASVVPVNSLLNKAAHSIIEDRPINFVLDGQYRINRMLPHELFQKFFSFYKGAVWPAITIFAVMDMHSAKITDISIRRTALEPQQKLTQEELAKNLRTHPSGQFNRWQKIINNMLLDDKADNATGAPPSPYDSLLSNLKRQKMNSSTRADLNMIPICMTLANEFVASLMHKHNIPFLFYEHPSSESGFTINNDSSNGRRQFSTTPINGPHFSPAPYCSFSTPAKMAANLIAHQQLAAFLDGETPPYTKDQLDQLAATFNLAPEDDSEDVKKHALQLMKDTIETRGADIIHLFRRRDLSLLVDEIVGNRFAEADVMYALGARIRGGSLYNKDLVHLLFSESATENLLPLKEAVIFRMNRVPKIVPNVMKRLEAEHIQLYMDEFILPGRDEEEYVVRYRMQTGEGWLCGSMIPTPTSRAHWAMSRGAIAFFDDYIHGRAIYAGKELAETRFASPEAANAIESSGAIGQLIVQLFQQGAAMVTATKPPQGNSDKYESDLVITMAGTGEYLLGSRGSGYYPADALEDAIAKLHTPQAG